MPKSEEPIPEEFNSIEGIQDFWDKHSTADYWDEMEDVDLQLSPAFKYCHISPTVIVLIGQFPPLIVRFS